MLSRICALLLVILSASPFSAPFSTCDAAMLFGSTATPARVLPRVPLSSSSTAQRATQANYNMPAMRVPTMVRTMAIPLSTFAPELVSSRTSTRHASATILDLSTPLVRPLRI